MERADLEKRMHVLKMQLSLIRTVMERARELERQGQPIVHLELGNPILIPLPLSWRRPSRHCATVLPTTVRTKGSMNSGSYRRKVL